MPSRKKGSNPHGFKNEELLVEALNKKKVKDLNLNLKRFVEDICKENKIKYSDDILIHAYIEKNNKYKQDFYIKIADKTFGISVKMGSGNSVHQEKIEDFIKSFKKITKEEEDTLRFFIWADGTIDGSGSKQKDDNGKIISRFNCNYFKKNYSEKRELLQKFFEKNAYEILERAIFIGKYNSTVDYVYHGNVNNGTWISKDEVINYNISLQNTKESTRATLSIGGVTIQPWNVSLEGKTDDRRGQIQFKYGCMVKHFEKLMTKKDNKPGTFEGEKEEFNLSKIMNKNKKHRFWSIIKKKCILDDDLENYYVVKVEGNKYSKLVDKKVKCKSDNFIINAKLDKSFLLGCEYQITEGMLENIGKYKKVCNSGISVKMPDSKYYTIVKLTHNTFKTAFANYIDDVDVITAGLILYSTDKAKSYNRKILNDLGVSEKKLVEYYKLKFKIEIEDITIPTYVKKINLATKEYVTKIIELNKKLKDNLFSGREWFEDPYCINFIFINNNLMDDIYTEYSISNGSGRSKGNYTIILKPGK